MTTMTKQTLAERIYSVLKENGQPMSIKEIAEEIQDKPASTVRGRIYENLGKVFRKIARGVYFVEDEDSACVVIEADGRKEGLQLLDDSSIDSIITDHPYSMDKALKGGNRSFADYNCFIYTEEDFREKARVLKEGGFLVEFAPAESEINFEYLYQMKANAIKAGFSYYGKTLWKKGDFVANTGRVSKTYEEILLFVKGPKARALRPDKKKILQGIEDARMSGTAYMLPSMFDYAPPSKSERIHQAEKPVELITRLIEAVTLPGEIVLDQFSGSGVLGAAVMKLKNRIGILFESMKENVEKIAKRLNATAIYKEQVQDIVETHVKPTVESLKPKKMVLEQLQLF